MDKADGGEREDITNQLPGGKGLESFACLDFVKVFPFFGEFSRCSSKKSHD